MQEFDETDPLQQIRKMLPLICVATIPAYFIGMVTFVKFVEKVSKTQDNNSSLFVGMAINAALWIALIMPLIPRLPFKELKTSSMEKKVTTFVICFVSIYATMALFAGIHYLIIKLTGYTPELQEIAQRISADSNKDLFLLALTPIILVPIIEEIIFRGLIHRSLRDISKPVYAAIISAALFALVHGEVRAMPQLFVLGLIFSYAYEKTDSLAVPALLHAFNNFLTIVFLLFYR